MAASATKTIDRIDLRTIPTEYEVNRLSLDEDDKIALAIKILQKWGTCELDHMQVLFKFSISTYQRILSTPDIPVNRPSKRPVSSEFLKEAPFILAKHPDAKFFMYHNQVGSYYLDKTVLLVNISGKEYIVRTLDKGQAVTYLREYERLREKQHRPYMITLACEDGAVITLSEFIGSDAIDYRNRNHLALAVALIPAFAEERTIVDFNTGNLVIKDGKLFFIDKDIFPSNYRDQEEATNKCLENLEVFIGFMNYPEHDELVTFVKTQAAFLKRQPTAPEKVGTVSLSSREVEEKKKA